MSKPEPTHRPRGVDLGALIERLQVRGRGRIVRRHTTPKRRTD